MRGDETLTAKDVAAILHIGKNTVYDLAKEGSLPSYKIGRKLFFTLSAVEAYRASLVNADSNQGSHHTSNYISSSYLQHLTNAAADGTHLGSNAFAISPTMPTVPNNSQGMEASLPHNGEGPASPQSAVRLIGGRGAGVGVGAGAGQPTLSAASMLNEQLPQYMLAPDMLIGASVPAPLTIAGNDIGVDFLCRWLNSDSQAVEAAQRTCYSALVSMYCKYAAGAVISLYDRRTNSYNTPFIQRLVPGTPVRLMHLGSRKRGFAVAPGNPKKVTTWGGVLKNGVRLANLPMGSASRVLLDEKLVSLEADPSVIANYDYAYASEVGAAQAVAAGLRDVAVVGEHVARCVSGVEFVPMQTEWLDVVVLKSAEHAALMKQLKALLTNPGFRAEFANVTHTDTQQMGAIVYEC